MPSTQQKSFEKSIMKFRKLVNVNIPGEPNPRHLDRDQRSTPELQECGIIIVYFGIIL